MRELRIGTRGSDLALTQTRWVCACLRALDPDIVLHEVSIKTFGDERPDVPIDEDWPAGGFVGAIERALLDGRIDLAVHSFKDLPSENTHGLVIAAVPQREVEHDVLVLHEPVRLSSLPKGFRIGTSSPRRTAQLRRLAPVEIVPVRGNVVTRLARMERDGLDGVILAAAGLKRLRIKPPHAIALPTRDFLPAPAQGALAVQVRVDDELTHLLSGLDHKISRVRVEAERALLAVVGPGCHTPVAALATIDEKATGDSVGGDSTLESEIPRNRTAHGRSTGPTLQLQGQLFADTDGGRMVEGSRNLSIGSMDPPDRLIDAAISLGRTLGQELMDRLALQEG